METANTIYVKDKAGIQNEFEIILVKGKKPVLKIYKEVEFKDIMDLLNEYSLKSEDIIIEPEKENSFLPGLPYKWDNPFYEQPNYPIDFFKITSAGTDNYKPSCTN